MFIPETVTVKGVLKKIVHGKVFFAVYLFNSFARIIVFKLKQVIDKQITTLVNHNYV